MRLLISIIAASALALAGCGGGDDDSSTQQDFTAPAPGEAPSKQIPTLGAYSNAPILLQAAAVQEVAKSEPACNGVDVTSGAEIYTSLAETADKEDEDTSFRDTIVDLCESAGG